MAESERLGGQSGLEYDERLRDRDAGAGGIWPGKRSSTSVMSRAARPGQSDDGKGLEPAAREAVDAAASSSGQGLPSALRGRLERSLGQDLGGVQVHTGAASATAARSVNALAYTIGQDVHFGEGQYNADSPGGELLIAHEVAHTVQQRGVSDSDPQTKLEVSTPGDAHEVEAERFAESFARGDAAAVSPVAVGTVSRAVIHRQPPQGGQSGGGGQSGQPSAGQNAQVTFQPQFDISPGRVAPGVVRTQQMVFVGDTLTFRASCPGVDHATSQLGVGGRVVGEGATPTTSWQGDTAVFQVVVGRMGIPGKPGEAPALVDAQPKIYGVLAAPNQGPTLETQTYSFKVVADFDYLSRQASAALGLGVAAYQGGIPPIKMEYVKFKAAYDMHKAALANAAKRQQLRDEIILNIMFAAFGGLAGGAAQQLIRGAASDVATIASATAAGDVAKYIVRLGASGIGAPGGVGAGSQTSGKPSSAPPASGGGASGAGMNPEVWLAGCEARFSMAASALTTSIAQLQQAMNLAWAAGRTELLDTDPVDLVAPKIAELGTVVPEPQTQQQYATALWREWIANYGYTLTSHIQGKSEHTYYETENNTDKSLRSDIKAQTGSDELIKNDLPAAETNADAKARRLNGRG